MRLYYLMLLFLFACNGTLVGYHYISLTPMVSGSRVIEIWVDKNFNELDMRSLDGAISEWNYVLNGHVKLVVESRQFDMDPNEIMRIHENGGWIIMKIESGNMVWNNWLAYCDHVGGHHMYMVRDRLKDGDMRRVFLHEIGHLLGSEHVGDHLMFKYYKFGRYSCVDSETASEVAFYWSLPIESLNFCVSN